MLKLAFCKGNRSSLFSWAICKWTHSLYSHVELVFIYSAVQSWCFSSDEQDGGTRFKSIHLDSEHWDLVDIPCSEVQYRTALEYARSKDHLKYDWPGIFGIAFKTGDHDDKDRFCSEICTEILQHTFPGWESGVKPWETSPGDLKRMISVDPIKAAA